MSLQLIGDMSEAHIVEAISQRLSYHLSRGGVVWFVSGGSNIALQVRIVKKLANEPVDLSRLTVLLIDERFGPVGHKDSNWRLLEDAGFFIDGPTYTAPFTRAENDLGAAVERYEAIIGDIISSGAYIVGQLGIGEDGHIAGIKPYSPALKSRQLVSGFQGDDWPRLTVTARMLQHIDEIVLVSLSDNKRPMIEAMMESGSSDAIPARILQTMPRVSVYTR